MDPPSTNDLVIIITIPHPHFPLDILDKNNDEDDDMRLVVSLV